MSLNGSIFLIDAKYLCYRSVYALLNEPISSVQNSMFYGFVSTLKSLSGGLKVGGKNVIKPSNVILCWDSRHSHRKVRYRGYKEKPKLSEHQEEVFKKIREAYPKLRQWMKRMGFNCAYATGFEADDIFAGFVRQFPEENFVIVTNDEDIYQLLSSKVSLWMLRKKPFLMTKEKFTNEYGIKPTEWASVKGLGGCTSDRIPGVPRVGEDTALKFFRGDLKGARLKWVMKNMDLALYWCQFTRLPYGNAEFNVSLDKSEINWDEFTRFAQIYGIKSMVYGLEQYMKVLNF